MDWRKANISLTLIQPTVYVRTPLIEIKLAKLIGKKAVKSSFFPSINLQFVKYQQLIEFYFLIPSFSSA